MAVSGSMSATLGAANPLRYRGYVYDSETSLYYLSSRYYNPVWGRFINADTAAVVAASPDKANWDKNLFATMTRSAEKMMAGTCGKKSPLWEILFFVAHSFLAVLQSVLQCYQLL